MRKTNVKLDKYWSPFAFVRHDQISGSEGERNDH